VFEPAAAIDSSGRVLLAAPNKPPAVSAADEVVTYEAQWHSTLRNDQRQASAAVLAKAWPKLAQAKRVGVEYSVCGLHHGLQGELVDVEPELLRLRRRKDPDELARLKKAIAATGAMYVKAREIVRPGIDELEVFNELQAAAVRELGEMMIGTGNDYACGERGGPPRPRKCQAGELYPLDLGPGYRGYWADNCRTLSVDHQPTKPQLAAWQRIVEALQMVQELVRPGVSCRSVFEAVDHHLASSGLGEFGHHLGHGIGLFPHEGPHLNPFWDDTFEVGDVFTAEPGLYSTEMRAGIRLENDYLVTERGVELLTPFPLELA
jgi:Xaa-Pro aminopeptidase